MRLTKETKERVQARRDRFLEWATSDNVVKLGGKWFTQCSQYSIGMTFEQLYRYFIWEYVRGVVTH